jgi:asparagine synthase (glutamine-hydrolysing)
VCGITGLVSRQEVDPSLVERMNDALVHRGPDTGSVTALGTCALGYRRLRVVDLVTGDQPVVNETGSVSAVFNGELYEFAALREGLRARGHAVPGTGDTPVIPHLYEEHDRAFARELHGMFAIALWDAERRRLVLTRDRIGKKPLLYTVFPDGSLAFASELKALLQLRHLERTIDAEALDAYLALQYVPGPRTALETVRKLPPGHTLVWQDGAVSVEPYWQLGATFEASSEEEWLELVRAEVRAAVRRRLIADVPLGALLSGGIDSTVVVGLMAEASSEPVRTFTIGFPDERYDERGAARVAAAAFGTRHEELDVRIDPLGLVSELAWTVDEPLGDEAVLPTLLISRLAREHVTVALVGDGGDEAFAGYERYAAVDLAGTIGRVPVLPVLLARLLRALPSGRAVPRSPAFRAARLLETAGAPSQDRYGMLMEVFPAPLREELYGPALADVRPRDAAILLGPPPAPGPLGWQLLDAGTYLPWDLLPKADLASMAASLELRAPLLDHRVLELGVSLPARLRVSGRTGKVALRRAFADLIPAPLARRPKSGFGVPIGDWLRHELRDLVTDVLLDATARARGTFDARTVERLLREHQTRDRDHGHRLWCLLVLELWRRCWLDPPVPPASRVAAAATVSALVS